MLAAVARRGTSRPEDGAGDVPGEVLVRVIASIGSATALQSDLGRAPRRATAMTRTTTSTGPRKPVLTRLSDVKPEKPPRPRAVELMQTSQKAAHAE